MKNPSPATVIAARNWWLQALVYGGSGWFEAHHASKSQFADPNSPDRAGEIQRAEDLFDMLAEEGAFSNEWYEKCAEAWNRDSSNEKRIGLEEYPVGMVARRIPMLNDIAAPPAAKVEEAPASVPAPERAKPEVDEPDLPDDHVEPLTDETDPKK